MAEDCGDRVVGQYVAEGHGSIAQRGPEKASLHATFRITQVIADGDEQTGKDGNEADQDLPRLGSGPAVRQKRAGQGFCQIRVGFIIAQ